jgi:hypothetical protein
MRLVNILLLLIIANGFAKAHSPLSFTENKGQIRDQHYKPRPDVLYSGSANGLVYHLKKDGLHYQLSRVESWKEERNPIQNLSKEKSQVPDKIGIYRVDVNWLNSSPTAQLYSGEPLPGYDNYYNVPDGVAPALFVKSYKTVNYHHLYEGIDLKFYTDENVLEYDFIVQPFADYKQIKIQIKGAQLEITPQKELKLITPFGNIIEGALKVYQNGKPIPAEWKVQDNVVSFHIPHYDPSQPLRIDPPVRVWGTYVGGSDVEYAYGCAVDNYKRSSIAGCTYSTNNIATTGAHQTNYVADEDGFVSSFAEWGTRRWSTYLGGSLDDVAYACEATPGGEVIIGGSAKSTTGITTSGAHQSTHGDAGTFSDGFVSKFDTSGVLVWSTYLGGSWQDEVKAIAQDTAGNLYITGFTQSSDNISTPGAYNPNYNGSKDVFLIKMSGNGSVLWGTYFGDANDEEATGIAVRNGKVALTGITNSTSNIASMGAHQSILQGPKDIFVTVFDISGQLDWATYYGGTLTEEGGGVALDSIGNVYVSGTTWSSSNISTTGAFQSSFKGRVTDAFLVKFSPQGQRIWGTYYGGLGNDEALYCHVDPFGDIYFGGTTASSSDIASSNGYKTFIGLYNYPIENDAFLVKFRSNGTRIWATYYGGENYEVSHAVATDTAGNIFLGGYTRSALLVASDNFSHQKVLSGVLDAFLIRFNNNNITLPEIPTSVVSIEAQNITLYPNPASNQLWLKADKADNYAVKIFDIQGKLAAQYSFNAADLINISTNDFSNGMYLLQISNTNTSFTRRFIIQH